MWTISARTPDCRRYRRPAAVPALDVINMKCTRTISVQLRRACVLANLTFFPVALTSTHFDDLISPFSRVLAHSIGIPYCTTVYYGLCRRGGPVPGRLAGAVFHDCLTRRPRRGGRGPACNLPGGEQAGVQVHQRPARPGTRQRCTSLACQHARVRLPGLACMWRSYRCHVAAGRAGA